MQFIDASVIVIFIIIWVLVYVLSKTFFKPVQRFMAEREAKIQHNRESCEKALEAYGQSISEIEESLKEAKSISDAKKEEFEKEALLEKKRFLDEINVECLSQIEEARVQLKKKSEDFKKKLEPEVKIIAEKIEKKLVH